MDRSNKIWLGVAVLLGMTVYWWLSASNDEPSLVATRLPERSKDSLPEAAIAKRFRHVELSSRAVDAVQEGEQVIELTLFPG